MHVSILLITPSHKVLNPGLAAICLCKHLSSTIANITKLKQLIQLIGGKSSSSDKVKLF
ncbi:hypothetical protein NC651_016345 [Populus alba x Populus x berolinensis]|nr:hypothetical protein NC651_016345 [Populus alba x Populus x berolinensis]